MTERKVKNTDRIYERDSSVSHFEAKVLSCEADGGEYKVVLSRTAFFPTGGGQSCDTGTLNGIEVTDVNIKNGEIIHVLPLPVEVGQTVHGIIDYAEREEKMQSHTAEHILSSVLNTKYGLSNVGFHLGTVDTTCDFDGVLTLDQLNDAEDEVNRIIRENHPVFPVFPSENELKTLEYRSKLDLTEDVRIVMIGENGSVDKCACCAPHVRETGNIGYFKIVDFYKYKGGTRVHILTGQKAVERARDDFEGIKTLSALLSAPRNAQSVSEAAERIREENEALEREISVLNGRINELICASITDTELSALFDGRTDVQTLRSLCLSAAEKVKTAVVFGGEDGRFNFVIAGEKAQDTFAKMKNSLNVRGGGKEVICGTVFATESEIKTLFDGENI
ncbi:MAG: alanyl-tRNA editing protein [Clostridia bacterium]|nr:alanyl-tRNA editing protein [Clostridia bacterium]